MKIAVARLGLVLLGMLAGVAVLAALELALRLAGAGEGPPGYDPFVGFSAAVPLFTRCFLPSLVVTQRTLTSSRGIQAQ